MTEKEIISEIIRYLSDTSYNYAVMIDGNWGCGKTYFVNHGLTDAIKEKEKDSRQPRKPLYISLYGCRSILDIQDSIAVKLPFVKNTRGRKVPKRIQQSRVVENSMQSAVVLAKAARDIYAPNISAFDIAVIWKDLKSYIFIFDKAVKQMLANIASTNNPKSLNRRFVFYEGTPAIVCRAKQIISEIEEAIAQRNNTTRALSIEEALQQPDWAAQLLSLTGEKNRLSTGALISNTDSEVWIALLKTASPETINKFREWLSFVYSDDDISFEKKADIVILQKVSDGLNPNEFSDLIVKKSLQWLKGDIERICAYYQ